MLFLSGCHTAQAPNRGVVPSLSHALVKAGADTVLGWARPVYEDTGIFAAERLYHALATGESRAAAVADVRRKMLLYFLQHPDQPICSDWHLLRLYQGVPDVAPLITPRNTPGRANNTRRPPQLKFLDPNGQVKVAAGFSFFGRRRELQRSLKALADPSEHYGVILYGIGGYGKSTIAARLCRQPLAHHLPLLRRRGLPHAQSFHRPTLRNEPGGRRQETAATGHANCTKPGT